MCESCAQHKKCDWCSKEELKSLHCDYWDNEAKDFRLKLCEDCHKERFSHQHRIALLETKLQEIIDLIIKS